MPRVPSYGPRKVAPAPLAGARAQGAQTYASAGGPVAEAAAGLGATVAKITGTALGQIWQEERDRADQLSVLNAKNQLAETTNGLLYDPEKGALNIKGGPDVMMPLREKVLQDFDAKAGEIAGVLKNDKQRMAFDAARASERLGLDESVSRHTSQQLDAFEDSETRAYLANSQNAAIASLDPVRIKQEFANQADTVRTHGARLGLGPEAQQALLAKMRSETHVSVIEGLLAKDQDQRASLYYNTAKDEIAGDKRAAVEKALEEGTLRGTSQQKADAIVAAGGSLTEQLDQVRAIDDPKLRDAVQERVEHAAVVNERAEREQAEGTLRSAYDVVDKAHTVSKISPAVWTSLSGSDRSALRSYAKSLTEGTAVKTDYDTLYTLITLSSTDPDKFAKTNLLRYRTQLSNGDLEQLMRAQAEARKGKDTSALFASEKNQNQMVDEALTSMQPGGDAAGAPGLTNQKPTASRSSAARCAKPSTGRRRRPRNRRPTNRCSRLSTPSSLLRARAKPDGSRRRAVVCL
jgi:hypothetical protein